MEFGMSETQQKEASKRARELEEKYVCPYCHSQVECSPFHGGFTRTILWRCLSKCSQSSQAWEWNSILGLSPREKADEAGGERERIARE